MSGSTNGKSLAALREIAAELDKCSRCGVCQADCPTYNLSQDEALLARGKIRLAQAALDGEISIGSAKTANAFSSCLSCMSCQASCPVGVKTIDVFDAAREEIFKARPSSRIERALTKRLLPYPNRLRALSKLVGIGALLYRIAPAFMTRFLPFTGNGVRRALPNFLKPNLRARLKPITRAEANTPGRREKIVYFSGCLTDMAFSETGENVAKILSAAGFDILFPREQLCCGAPAWFAGDVESARELARANVDALDAIDAETIICSCATCASILKETYPKLLPNDVATIRLVERIFDFQQVALENRVEELIRAGTDRSAKLKVAYHDPCHLKRGVGVWREPRELLRSLPGVEYVEMENADSCCGGAGAFSLKRYDIALRQGARKADAIARSGADIIVTECPSCQLQLTDSVNRLSDSGDKAIVMGAADLIGFLIDRSKK